jgi:hypothetical protein
MMAGSRSEEGGKCVTAVSHPSHKLLDADVCKRLRFKTVKDVVSVAAEGVFHGDR